MMKSDNVHNAEWIITPESAQDLERARLKGIYKQALRSTPYYCSKCGGPALSYPFWECDLFLSKYCPHCGEEMLNGKSWRDE